MKPPAGCVLIADDEPHVRELLRDFLTGEGYAVVMVASGAAALETVPTFQPDVIHPCAVCPVRTFSMHCAGLASTCQ